MKAVTINDEFLRVMTRRFMMDPDVNALIGAGIIKPDDVRQMVYGFDWGSYLASDRHDRLAMDMQHDDQADRVRNIGAQTVRVIRRENNQDELITFPSFPAREQTPTYDSDSAGALGHKQWRGVPRASKDFGVKPPTTGRTESGRVMRSKAGSFSFASDDTAFERINTRDTFRNALEAWYSRLSRLQRKKFRRAIGVLQAKMPRNWKPMIRDDLTAFHAKPPFQPAGKSNLLIPDVKPTLIPGPRPEIKVTSGEKPLAQIPQPSKWQPGDRLLRFNKR